MSGVFAEHVAIWDRLADEDPFWAVLSDPAKRGGGWDPDAFFATGQEHVDWIEEVLQEVGHTLADRRALDFGCGIGRLTQAIAATASFTMGVDASVPMVIGAQRWNRYPERCAYVLNRSADLAMLPDRSFDVVVSFIVLQHIPPPASHRYLAELARLVAPGGVQFVQVPEAQTDPELPDAAFRARVRVLEVPARLLAGVPGEIVVEVRNESDHRWELRERWRLRVGNHWTSLDGGPAVADDGRAELPPLGPGEQWKVALPVVPPGLPGLYRLDVDALVEGQAWFANHGSPTAAVAVLVGPSDDIAALRAGRTAPPPPAPAEAAGDEDPEPTSFGMFGIPKDDVLRLLDEAGLQVLEVQPDGSAGSDWTSWRYLAGRPGSRR